MAKGRAAVMHPVSDEDGATHTHVRRAMSTHDRRRPKLPPRLEQLFKELITLRQGAGITGSKLAAATGLLRLPSVQDEARASEVNEIEALRRVLECYVNDHPNLDVRIILRMAFNMTGSPFDLTDRRSTLSEEMSKHFDTIRADEDAYLTELLTSLEASRVSPCRGRQVANRLHETTHLIGRDQMLAELRERVSAATPLILSLNGVPGAGKTAIARRLANQLAERWQARIAYLHCRDASADDLIFTLMMQLASDRSLYHSATSPPQRVAALKRAIGHQPLIIVADDIHDGPTAETLHGIIEEGVLIATTRRRDLVTGPHAVNKRVSELGQYHMAEALWLWGEGSRSLDMESRSIERLHQLTNGNPLAVKILGRRLAVIGSIQEVVRRLEVAGTGFLVAARRASGKESVEAALQVAIADLDDSQNMIFHACGSHAGGHGDAYGLGATVRWSPIAASEELEFLYQENLVEYLYQPDTGWRLHPLISDYLTRRHRSISHKGRLLKYYSARLSEGSSALRTPAELAWLRYLDQEDDNLEPLIDWSVETGLVGIGAEAAHNLGWYWAIRTREIRARSILKGMLSHGRAHRIRLPNLADLHVGSAWLATNQADFADAARHFRQAVAIFDRERLRARARDAASALAYAQWGAGHFEAAIATATPLTRSRHGPTRGTAYNTLGLCASHQPQPDYERAEGYFERAVNVRREIGDEWGVATSLGNLAEVARARRSRSLAEVRQMQGEALEIRTRHGDRWAKANALSNLGELDIAEDDYVQALDRYSQSLAIFIETQNPLGAATALTGIALIAAHLGDRRMASGLVKDCRILLQDVSVPLGPAHKHHFERLGTEFASAGNLWASASEWFSSAVEPTEAKISSLRSRLADYRGDNRD
jgi:tetratricopeptide (TPR) repeat protein